MSICIKNSRLLYCLICGLGLVLFSAQGSHADSSPSIIEELCNEPGRPTLQKQFELAGHPLRNIPGFCRWLLQPPIVYRQSPQSGKSDSSGKELVGNADRELNQPDPKPGLEEFEEENVHLQPIQKEEKKESLVGQESSEPVVGQKKDGEEETVHTQPIQKEEKKESSVEQESSEPVVEQRLIEPEIQPVEPPEIKAKSKQVEPKAAEPAAQQKIMKTTPEEPTLKISTEPGWQVFAGATEANYSERGYEVALQGQSLGARYQLVGPWGTVYGLQQHWLREEGQAQIGDVAGKLEREQWQFGFNSGVELGHQYWLRLQLMVLLGWQEDRLSYRHQKVSGEVQYSETIGNGQFLWGYELSPVFRIAENWLLGTRWQQRMDSLQIRYGDGTNAEILSKPAWQIWIEYR
jgi:hypothetical protein